MKVNRYVEDILAQPGALRQTAARYAPAPFAALAEEIRSGAYERIILSGMGSSHYASYPAWLRLLQQGLPAWTVPSAELLHYAPALVTAGSLLWLTSQSGASVEVQALVEGRGGHQARTILATTANPDSPLGRAAGLLLQLHFGEESTVSTGSYLTTLAVQHLALTQIAGGDVEAAAAEVAETASGLASYLEAWPDRVAEWERLVGVPEHLYLVGRGPSLAAVATGSLIIKESAKFAVEGLSAAQFRHGPLELADERLTVLVFAGLEGTRELNERLAKELQAYGARVVWLDWTRHPALPSVLLPPASAATAPIAEMVPLQLLSLALARQTGVEAGVFRHIGKVTRSE